MESDETIGGIPLKVSSRVTAFSTNHSIRRWNLKALPCLSELICQRWHPDLPEFLRESLYQ